MKFKKIEILKEKEEAILRYYLTENNNQISLIAEFFSVSCYVVNRIINNHFKK